MIRLGPLGDRAFLARFASKADADAWARAVRDAHLRGVVDVVLAYSEVAVFADPDSVEMSTLSEKLGQITGSPLSSSAKGHFFRIPVLYAGEDLAEISERTGMSAEDVISCHAGPEYRVLAVGFLPGFAYLGELPPRLSGLPRRDSPRSRVPAGSVAIAGRQTGIYPEKSPGGWHLLGMTPIVVSEAAIGFFPLAAGDRVRFETIGADEFRERVGERLTAC